MLSWLKQLVAKPAQAPATTPEHLKLAVLQRDIPRYPPFMKGLPLETPSDILGVQEELMRQIYQSTKTTREDFQKHYQSAIERFASFVHLLPASQGHHHRGAGGLLRHSLEVALWSLREADKMLLLELCKTPGHRRQIEPRWLLTAFLAGLCHDVGKPATDVVVRNHDSSRQWNPLAQSLWNWGQNEGVDAYFLEWQSGRAKSHVALTGALAKNIISDATLAWVASESQQLCLWLMETLNGTPGSANPLFDIVIKADQKSVERDLKSMGAVMAGYDLGVPVERMLTDIMRRLIRQGIWSVNEPGAKVWCIDGNVYLVWPTSGQDIATQVKQDGIPGVPRNADSILDMLIERELAFTDTQGLYKIAPACLSVKIPDIKLSCIRLRDDTLVSSEPLASVDGLVLNDAGEQVGNAVPPTAPAQGAAEEEAPVANPQQSQGPSANPGGQEAKTHDAEATRPADPPDQAAQAQPRAPALAPEGDQPGKASGKKKQRVLGQSMPLMSGSDERIDPDTGEILREAPHAPAVVQEGAQDAHQTSISQPALQPRPAAATKQAVCSKPSLTLDGLVGEALKALAEDLRSGAKRWNQQAFEEPDGRVLLAWPEAFAGYGLTPSSILNDLASKDWCVADPYIPTKRVIERTVDGRQLLVIHLHHDVSEALIYAAKRVATSKDREPPQEREMRLPREPMKEVVADAPVAKADMQAASVGQGVAPANATQHEAAPEVAEKRRKKKKKHSAAQPATEGDAQAAGAKSASEPVLVKSQPIVSPEQADARQQLPAPPEQERQRPKTDMVPPTTRVIDEETIAGRKIDAIVSSAMQLEISAKEGAWLCVGHLELQNELSKNGAGITRAQLHKIARENPKIFRVDGGNFWLMGK